MKKLLACLLFLPLAASAIITVEIDYSVSTGDTVVTYSGEWLSFSNQLSLSGASQSAFEANGVYNLNGDYEYNGTAFPTPLPWAAATVTGSTGDDFGFDHFGYYAEAGYTNGQSISGTLTLGGTSLEDLGLTDGQFGSITNGSETVNWTASGGAVPEPSTYGLLAGLSVLGAMLLRRRR